MLVLFQCVYSSFPHFKETAAITLGLRLIPQSWTCWCDTIFLSCSRAAWTAISQRFAVIRATCWTSSGIPSSRTSLHPALKTLRWGTFSSIYPSIFLGWFNGLSCPVAWLKPANGSCGTPLAIRSPTGSHDLSRRLKSQSPFALISAFDVT